MSAELEILPSLLDTQNKSTIGVGEDLRIDVGVGLSSECGAAAANSQPWVVNRETWASACRRNAE